MKFSETFQATKGLVRFSYDGRYAASCSKHRLVIRESDSFQIVHVHTCLDAVEELKWSPNSLFLLCAMYKRGAVQVCVCVCVSLFRHRKQGAGKLESPSLPLPPPKKPSIPQIPPETYIQSLENVLLYCFKLPMLAHVHLTFVFGCDYMYSTISFSFTKVLVNHQVHNFDRPKQA